MPRCVHFICVPVQWFAFNFVQIGGNDSAEQWPCISWGNRKEKSFVTQFSCPDVPLSGTIFPFDLIINKIYANLMVDNGSLCNYGIFRTHRLLPLDHVNRREWKVETGWCSRVWARIVIIGSSGENFFNINVRQKAERFWETGQNTQSFT